MKDTKLAVLSVALVTICIGNLVMFITWVNSAPPKNDRFFLENGEINAKEILKAVEKTKLLAGQNVICDHIFANDVSLFDSDGQIRMMIEGGSEHSDGGSRIVMYHRSGKIAFEIDSFQNGNVLSIKSPVSEDSVQISASSLGGEMTIWQGPTAAHWRTPPLEAEEIKERFLNTK